MKNMTGGQLTQIYNIATQQGCGQDEVQFLIESGYMADFFAGRWQEVNRTDFRKLGRLAPEDFGVKPDFKTFRTLKLGTGIKDADGFRKALKKADCNIGDWGNNILGKPAFKVAEAETEVELVVVSNAELGFENGATVKETYARAKELGLELCPNEVGPQLRLQYKDQPKGGWLLIAMEPITDSGGDLYVFYVERYGDGKQWLRGSFGHPDYRWHASSCWVFLRRK